MIRRVLGGTVAASLSLVALAPAAPAQASGRQIGGHAATLAQSAADLGSYYPLGPTRILDTRTGTRGFRKPVAPNSSIALQVAGKYGVPTAQVTAVVLNVTAVQGTRSSYVTVYPDGLSRPVAANLRFTAGEVITNLVTVPVGPDGKVRFYNHAGSVNLVANLAGYYSRWPGGALLNLVGPARVLDTRNGTGVRSGKVGPGKSITLKVTGKNGVPAARVRAVALTVTAMDATRASYVTVWPSGTKRPLAWNLNFTTAGAFSNLVIVPVSAAGTVSFYNHTGSVNLAADLAGYYTSAAEPPDVLSSSSYGLSQPTGTAFDGTHMWITNGAGSVTEVNASDGSLIRTLSGSHYGFDIPLAITFDGAHLWIANFGLAPGAGSVTEVNASDGSWVRTLSGGTYRFNRPDAIEFDGAHLWIANQDGNSVTEVNASDGSLVRVLSGGGYGINGPHGIAYHGAHLWITNNADSVTEVNASDGSLVRVISGATYHFNCPTGIAFDGAHLWITNLCDDSVTEVNASDGSWVRTLSGGSYAFNEPDAIVFDGTHLWIENYIGGTVTELNASDGSWVRTVSGGTYTPTAGLAFDGTRMWIADYGHNLVIVMPV